MTSRATLRFASPLLASSRAVVRPSAFTYCHLPALSASATSYPVQPLDLHRRLFHSTVIAKMPASAETASYRFNHTMIRVKDPEASLKFYGDVLGMDLIDEHDAGDFKLFFLAYQQPGQKNLARGEREGILELTWNKGTEKDSSFKYHNGNKEPQGFGHTCVSVDDIQKACDRFEKLGVRFQKKLTDGKMRNIAFILDPDDYWVEIISHGKPQ